MGGQNKEVKRRIHSIKYIYQLLEWGFTKEFIAADMGVELNSLETRLRRHKERELNDNKRLKPEASGNKPVSRSSEEIKRRIEGRAPKGDGKPRS
jgi:hypothetical protein